MNLLTPRSRKALLASTALVAGLFVAPIAPTQAAGFPTLRLVDPAPTPVNSFELTFDAKDSGWIKYYTPAMRAFFMYRNVGSTFSFTYEAKDSNGALMKNAPVYLIVNKNWSCSDGTYTTDVDTFYSGVNRPDARHIVGDWCGSEQKMFGGETSVPGTTDANGRVTFTLTNTNASADAEVAPVGKTVINTYSPGNLRYTEDPLSLGSTITASFVQHPLAADDNAENKDLLFVHLVNNSLKAEKAITTALTAAGTKQIRFRAVNLDGVPQANVAVSIVQMSGPDEASITPITGSEYGGIISTTSDASGWVTFNAVMTDKMVGDQEITAKIDDTRVSAKLTVSWIDVSPPKVTKAAVITGRAVVGATLAAAKGTWSGSPAITYSWLQCTAPGKAATAVPLGCTAIKSATKSTYKIAVGNRNKYIRSVVRGTNLAGAALTVSAATTKIK